MPWRRAGLSFVASDRRRDVSKPCSRHSCRRTAARVSAKVGRGLRYQASVDTAVRAWRSRRAASRDTRENSPSRQGVARAIARSDHWRWVSTPRWSRTSRKVTSTRRRRTNQRTTCSGSRAGSVRSRAWGSKRPRGSRSSTQRIGTTGEPAWRHTAVPEQTSTTRSPSPYRPGTAISAQRVPASARTAERFGRRAPLVRGRPTVPGRRGGAGSYRAASSRRRVTRIRPRRTSAARRSRAAKLASPTSTTSRPGSQRRAWRATCRAQSVSFLWRLPRWRQYRSEGARAVRNGRAQTRPAQGIGARSIRLSQRRPLALTKWPLRGADRVAVDALGGDALAPPPLDRVVDAEHHG